MLRIITILVLAMPTMPITAIIATSIAVVNLAKIG